MKSRQEIERLSRQKMKKRLMLILLSVMVVCVTAAIVLVCVMANRPEEEPTAATPPEILTGESVYQNYPIAYATVQESQLQVIKITNKSNKDENGETVCHYTVMDTSGKGISDGGWYRSEGEPDSMGGYFGCTEFVYGTAEGESFFGTENKDGITDSFVFRKDYYVI